MPIVAHETTVRVTVFCVSCDYVPCDVVVEEISIATSIRLLIDYNLDILANLSYYSLHKCDR